MMPMDEHELPVKTFGEKWIDMRKKITSCDQVLKSIFILQLRLVASCWRFGGGLVAIC